MSTPCTGVTKYKDKDSEPPKIYKLGSGAWQRMKLNTKKAVKDIARELIALYARRKAREGFAFSPDSYMQARLEASFIYEDTPNHRRPRASSSSRTWRAARRWTGWCRRVGFGKTETHPGPPSRP